MTFLNLFVASLLSSISIHKVAGSDVPALIEEASALFEEQNLPPFELDRFLEEEIEDNSSLDWDYQVAGERCGNRNTCQDGLDCNNPLLGVGAKRCWPSKDCLSSHMLEFQQRYNVTDYKTQIFEHAGVTESQLLLQLVDVKGDPDEFAQLPSVKKVMRSLQTVFWEQAQEIWNIQRGCTYPGEDEHGRRLEDVGGAGAFYLGLHIEGGLLIDGVFDLIWVFSQESTDPAAGQFIRLCLGGELGLGAEISFMFGINGNGDTASFNCGSIVGDVDAGLLVGIGMAVGLTFTVGILVEFTLGFALGAGAGLSFCYTFTAPTDAPTTAPAVTP